MCIVLAVFIAPFTPRYEGQGMFLTKISPACSSAMRRRPHKLPPLIMTDIFCHGMLDAKIAIHQCAGRALLVASLVSGAGNSHSIPMPLANE
jgi:hypothetical protein